MKVTVVRIESQIVSCALEDGHILDIDIKWLPSNIKIDDVLDFSVEVANNDDT